MWKHLESCTRTGQLNAWNVAKNERSVFMAFHPYVKSMKIVLCWHLFSEGLSNYGTLALSNRYVHVETKSLNNNYTLASWILMIWGGVCATSNQHTNTLNVKDVDLMEYLRQNLVPIHGWNCISYQRKMRQNWDLWLW